MNLRTQLSTRMPLALITATLIAVLGWRELAGARGAEPPSMKHVADIPLPGDTTRYDYQSLDPRTGRLYISHMGDGHLVVFDTKTNKVLANLPGFPTVTGVLFVPELNRVYASAAGAHEVVAVDANSLRTLARIPGPQFPDGLAYAPDERKLFVSDESGGKDYVIDTSTNRVVTAIDLGGEAGNTHYDPVSRHIFVAVQTRNLVAEIDPKTNRVIARHPLPGSEHPHGFTMDPARHFMFMSCEGNDKLLLVNMKSMSVAASFDVSGGPDVLAFDPKNNFLYVATENGGVHVFQERGTGLTRVATLNAPHAHTISVDPASHRIYLPLKDLNGKPVMRVMQP